MSGAATERKSWDGGVKIRKEVVSDIPFYFGAALLYLNILDKHKISF